MERDTRSRAPRSLWIAGIAALAVTLIGAGAVVTAGPLGWPGHRGHGGHGIDHVLRHLDASDEQRARIETILEDAFAQLGGWRDGHGALVQAASDALLGDPVDRVALETLRQEQLRELDASSARLVAAFADVAETLTPEQRAELAREFADRHGSRHRHGGGHGWFRRH